MVVVVAVVVVIVVAVVVTAAAVVVVLVLVVVVVAVVVVVVATQIEKKAENSARKFTNVSFNSQIGNRNIQGRVPCISARTEILADDPTGP
jgi:phage-related minor tail protein